MINTLVDSMASNDISFLNFIEKLLSETNTGWLVVDSKFKLIAVNAAYRQFHQLFNQSELNLQEVLTETDFVSFPDSYISNLKKVVSAETDKAKLQIDYLGNETLSFSITMIYLISREEDNFEGAVVMVQKKENKFSMQAIAENEEFFKLLVNTSTGVYQLTDAALVFTYTSSSVQDILGYTAPEMIGKNAIELVHPDDKEHVRDWLINIRRQPEKLLTAEYRVRTKQGKYVWIENNARNMFGNPSIKAIVMNFRNIQAKKVADDALINAEQRLSLLLNNTEESFILLNSRLRIVTYNKAAQERSPFFYNTELQSGLSVLDLISRDEIPDYIELFEQVFKGKEIERESKFVDAEKGLHIYSHTFRPLLNHQDDIQGVFITSTEITERKKLTEEVAIHSDRLKTAQTIARLGYLEYDTESGTFFCSELFYEILGLTEKLENWDQLAALRERVHNDDKELVKNEIQECILRGKDFNFEFRFNSNGDTRVILAIGGSEKDENGKTVKLRVTLQDITDSKMAILALQTLESKFKSLFENSIDGVILSKEDGEIVSANPSVCKMLGYEPSEIINLKSFDLIDMNSPAAADMQRIQRDTGSYIGELFLKHKNGDYVPAEVTSVCMTDGNDNSYLSTIIRDITEKKKIESEQKALTEELLKNNQDLQQFSFITSHNLRAPVANLLSLLSLYNKENPLDDFNQLLIEKFEEATQQLNQTLNDLVNILVIKSNNNIERETISFTEVFVDVKRNIDNLLKQKKGVIKADFSQVDQIQYNRIHIESLFLNMISNAIRYSSPERNPEIKITSYKTDNWVVVEFADNGLGMDLNRYGDRLFGLYQRFHGNKEGKGLGLYMTRSQVTAMGGKIEVESEPGKGSKFKIYFKLQD